MKTDPSECLRPICFKITPLEKWFWPSLHFLLAPLHSSTETWLKLKCTSQLVESDIDLWISTLKVSEAEVRVAGLGQPELKVLIYDTLSFSNEEQYSWKVMYNDNKYLKPEWAPVPVSAPLMRQSGQQIWWHRKCTFALRMFSAYLAPTVWLASTESDVAWVSVSADLEQKEFDIVFEPMTQFWIMFLLSCLEKNFLIKHITLTEEQAAVV